MRTANFKNPDRTLSPVTMIHSSYHHKGGPYTLTTINFIWDGRDDPFVLSTRAFVPFIIYPGLLKPDSEPIT